MKNFVSASAPTLEKVDRSAEIQQLSALSEMQQIAAGYGHTLREILQQPRTWAATAAQMMEQRMELHAFLREVREIVLTGSGSSEFAGECVRLVLQQELGTGAQTIAGGALLTEGGRAIAPERPCLMISLARSGDSPESVGALSLMLETEPAVKHLVITCNREGKLSQTYRDDLRVKVVALADDTNDRSLVMTSSFTNMVLAARSLGLLTRPAVCLQMVRTVAQAAEDLLQHQVERIADLARQDFQRILYLASGPRTGSAREAALKMQEMTAGRVMPMWETYLGLRHGPMSAVHADTLIVCFLSSESPAREYECDLVRELNRKQLGFRKLIFGARVPADLVENGDLVIECNALAEIGDVNAPLLDIVIGQLLAFFRCMAEGLTPDSPSESGVIHRVVEEFALHVARD